MFCPNCGQRLQDGAKFCTICGSKIEETPAVGGYNYDQKLYEQEQRAYSNYASYEQQTEEAPYCDDSPHPETLNSTYAWLLAIVPGILGIIYAVSVISRLDVDNIDYRTSIESSFMSLLMTAPSLILLGLDGYMLRKSNYRLIEFWWIGFLMMPVYLFVRAYKTDKKYGYAITWCVLYAVEIIVVAVLTISKVYSLIGGYI